MKEHDFMSKYYGSRQIAVCPNCDVDLDMDELWTMDVEKVFELNCPHCNKPFLVEAEETRVFTTGFFPSKEQKKRRDEFWGKYKEYQESKRKEGR